MKESEEAIKMFRALIDPEDEGGRRRREILAYIAKNPGCNAYEIARDVYGSPPLKYYKSVTFHLDKLREVSERLKNSPSWGPLFEEKEERGVIKISLTEKGRELCRAEGIEAPTGRTEEFIRQFHQKSPLTPDKIKEFRRLLSDPVMDALEAINQEWTKRMGVLKSGTLELSIKRSEIQNIVGDEVLRVLQPIWWYEAEKEVKALAPDFAKRVSAKGCERTLRAGIRYLPKTLPAVKLHVEEGFVVHPIVEKGGLQENFEELMKFTNEVIAQDPFFLSAKETSKTAYLTFLLARVYTNPQFWKEIGKAILGGKKIGKVRSFGK
jgi:DNA-binding transcriptional ArsR family regulator